MMSHNANRPRDCNLWPIKRSSVARGSSTLHRGSVWWSCAISPLWSEALPCLAKPTAFRSLCLPFLQKGWESGSHVLRGWGGVETSSLKWWEKAACPWNRFFAFHQGVICGILILEVVKILWFLIHKCLERGVDVAFRRTVLEKGKLMC